MPAIEPGRREPLAECATTDPNPAAAELAAAEAEARTPLGSVATTSA